MGLGQSSSSSSCSTASSGGGSGGGFFGSSSSSNIPGVLRSEDYTPPAPGDGPVWRGSLTHIITDNMKPETVQRIKDMDTCGAETLDERPYTFAERTGMIPVHPTRLQPREYYYPTTDFSAFDYDDASPEEKLLRKKWLTRLFEWKTRVPTMFTMGSILTGMMLNRFRYAVIMGGIVIGMQVEFARLFMRAMPERQDLDDFILAKELWYIKNVEVEKMGFPVLGPGEEFIQKRTEVSLGENVFREDEPHLREMQETYDRKHGII